MNMMNSAKKFAMKNKDKIAAGVDKATDAIDKKTHGKYHDKLEKVDGASAKLAGKPKEEATTAAAATAAPAAAPATDDKKSEADETNAPAETDAS